MLRHAEEIDGKSFDVAIIGAGLGGLECGYILAKNGLNICILEKNPLPGGCLQSFIRKGAGISVEFDSGLHYVGGLDEGQALNTLFKYFNLMHLPWQKMDKEAFDEVNINGQKFLYANGHNEFAKRMTDYFPHEKGNIEKYTALLKEVGESLPRSLSPKNADDVYTGSLFARSAYSFLCETIKDPLLREVLSGTSLKMELGPALPLYTFAQINNSFIESAYRLNGGGNLVWKSLVADIEKMGGTVAVNSHVTEVCGNNITIGGKYRINAKNIISNLHPSATMEIIGEEAGLRKVYRNRISRLPNTYGMFTANMVLKPNKVKYMNRNRYIHLLENGQSLWNRAEKSCTAECGTEKVSSLLASYYTPQVNNSNDNTNNGIKNDANSVYAHAIDLLAPMEWIEVQEYAASKRGMREKGYYRIKENKLQQCLELAYSAIPELEGNIEEVYTSTPLTYRDYTATCNGSAYGIKKDCNNLMLALLTPKTPLPNLFLTGQCLNLHGVLGVSMTSFFTCAHIIGMESAVKELGFNKL